MRGYSEHRKTTNGRLDLEGLGFSNYSNEVCISARESRKKDRGVDIRTFLNTDDIIAAIRVISAENDLLRLRLKAEIAAIDYEVALFQQQRIRDTDV